MEFASCDTCGANNFEVAPRFLENLCTPDLTTLTSVQWKAEIMKLFIAQLGNVWLRISFS
jgi:hypothetical protein